ncbi:MAG: NUDIX hydrolase [Proteobacteria bacterium]|nr:NUDIX hydrolase [Pseudomonadota bacterium]
MKYCSACANPVERRVPNGDNRERFVCDSCGTIHYQNPKIVTGCLPIYQRQVLLCRRAIQPRSGLWTLPAGFLENGETSTEGAVRETLEEACANVAIEGLYTVFNLPHISQVYMFFRAELLDLDFRPGWESTDVRLFHEADIPWDELAFPVIRDTLQHYFRDRSSGIFPVHVGDIVYPKP